MKRTLGRILMTAMVMMVTLTCSVNANAFTSQQTQQTQQRENNIKVQGMVERQIIWMQHNKGNKQFISVLHSYHELCKSLEIYYGDSWCTALYTNRQYLILAFKNGV